MATKKIRKKINYGKQDISQDEFKPENTQIGVAIFLPKDILDDIKLGMKYNNTTLDDEIIRRLRVYEIIRRLKVSEDLIKWNKF